ncbi:MAG: tetratricopeptide repeat protein [Desulfovibrionaceae bacterium]
MIRHLPLEVAETFTMGAMAIAFLMSNKVDVVLCDSHLEDMSGIKFLQTLKTNRQLKNIPVVVITSVSDRNTVLDFISAGCSGYVIRPYNNDTFERHVTTALQLQRFEEIEVQQLGDAKRMLDMGNFDDAVEEFEEIISQQESAQKYYDMGCHYLIKQKWGKAIVSFQKAIRLNDLYAEAYQGLAEAYKGKGELDKSKQYLQRAADIHAEFNRMEQVKALFVDILKMDSNAPNPFNTLGVKLRKQGDYVGALHAYTQAIGITPNDENIYFNMAKAYYFMEQYDQAEEKVTLALSLNSDFPEAAIMFKKLTSREWQDSNVASVKEKSAGGSSLRDV